MSDVLADSGPVFLGSRLTRLAEQMRSGAGAIITESGIPAQPAHMPVLAALDRGPATVGQLVEAVGFSQPGITRSVGQLCKLGLVQSEQGEDQRQRLISLTAEGEAAMARTKMLIWPRVTAAVEELLGDRTESFLAQIAELESALAASSLHERAAKAAPATLKIRPFSDELAQDFHDINAEWIEAMFRLEQADREVLENPRKAIIEPGGDILFVEAEGLGIVGTCALQNTGGTGFELTKMGVRKSARGLKAGEFLLEATIARAQELGADPLYLLTNKACAPAIHLYEKLGFRHDAEIMRQYGARYARCDVAMRYCGDG